MLYHRFLQICILQYLHFMSNMHYRPADKLSLLYTPSSIRNIDIYLIHQNGYYIMFIRCWFMTDGGNVELVEIDGPTVYLRLQGACGSCPSSTSTMTMGIRRKLQESIPVRPLTETSCIDEQQPRMASGSCSWDPRYMPSSTFSHQ